MSAGPIDGADWVMGKGAGPYWRRVTGVRAEAALREVADAAVWLRRSGPAALSSMDLARSFADIRRAPEAVRGRLLLFPAFDCWLSVTKAFMAGERPPEEAALHFAYFQSFAAALAAMTGARRRLKVRLSKDARFHVTGTREWFEFPRAAAGAEAVCEAAGGKLCVRWGRAAGRRRLLPALTENLWVEQRDPLALQAVIMHGLARFSAREEDRFVAVLTGAMARIRAVDPAFFEEMEDFLRLMIPLDNPKDYGSVSSSYRNLRGALCLSHSGDSLLQEETLIHEFCHQKVNLLFAADPLLKPGQGGQVVYSPLRPDARRLGGLLLGAHAFINVNRYLLRVLRREPFPERVKTSVQTNLARRLFHVEDMLRTVSMYADLTAVGARFQARMWREHALTVHDALEVGPKLMEEGRRRWREHRVQKALGETGLYAAAAPEAVKP